MRTLVRELESAHESSLAKAAYSAADEYEELYQIAPIGFFTLDRQGRICEVNERGARLLGFPAGWLIGRAFVVFVAKKYIHDFLDNLRDSTRHPEPREMEFDLFVGNTSQPVRITLATTFSDGTTFHRMTVIDLSDVRKTEGLLQESLASWYSLVHNAPDTIMTVDPSGRISFVNKPAWGYSADALVGTNILKYVADVEQPKLLDCLKTSFEHNRRSICETSGVNGDWDKWYQFSFGSPHANLARRTTTTTTTTTLVIREISEHKHAEEKLRVSG